MMNSELDQENLPEEEQQLKQKVSNLIKEEVGEYADIGFAVALVREGKNMEERGPEIRWISDLSENQMKLLLSDTVKGMFGNKE